MYNIQTCVIYNIIYNNSNFLLTATVSDLVFLGSHCSYIFRRHGDRGRYDITLKYLLYYRIEERTGRVQHYNTSLLAITTYACVCVQCMYISLTSSSTHCTYIVLLSYYIDDIIQTTLFVPGQYYENARVRSLRRYYCYCNGIRKTATETSETTTDFTDTARAFQYNVLVLNIKISSIGRKLMYRMYHESPVRYYLIYIRLTVGFGCTRCNLIAHLT